ncbi:MAG: flagellar hook protein FlgE [Caldilineaceae bacterium]|nr:flagellar hook protein FlgE [Caldilineaceae bacterium]
MSSSMLTAASALRNHQTYMNVIANNIANMNTIGFKSSNVLFQDMLSRSLSVGAAPGENRGGINPLQIGLGMQLGSISTNMGQGVMQSTGRPQDLALTGSGFFIYGGAQQPIYSRDGSLGMDAAGNLVNLGTGLRVQGWKAVDDGTIDTAKAIGDITIPIGAPMAAVPTSGVDLSGNLDASADINDSITTTVQFYDSLGGLNALEMTFTKTATNTWSVDLDPSAGSNVALSAPVPATVTFDEDGQLIAPADGQIGFTGTLTNGAANVDISLNIASLSQLESPGADELYVTNQNGRAPGQMIDFNISNTGEIVAIYSNGLLKTLGQLAVAEFVNPSGLTKSGGNGYTRSGNSGDAQVVQAGDRTTMSAGFLELSNVDLTLEFSEMIRAQRGFQANSRVITSSDEMLQELVNLVR